MTKAAFAKNKALKKEDYEKFQKLEEKLIREGDLHVKDVVDETTLKQIEFDDAEGPGEEETNKLIEDVWENFKKDINNTEIGLEKHVKEKVNEKLQQYLKENSHYLSANVERYMSKVSKGEVINDNERI